MDNRVIAAIARKHAPRLVEQAIDRLMADPLVRKEVAPPGQKAKKPSLAERMANALLVRVATRSVPGAILVGGGLIAKALHDRHKARQGRG